MQLNSHAGVGSTGSGFWSDAILANGVDAPNWGALETVNPQRSEVHRSELPLDRRREVGRAPPQLRLGMCPNYAAVEAGQLRYPGVEVGSENSELAIWHGVPGRVLRPQWGIRAAVQEGSILSSVPAKTGRTSRRKA